jgi:hypothetical protein
MRTLFAFILFFALGLATVAVTPSADAAPTLQYQRARGDFPVGGTAPTLTRMDSCVVTCTSVTLCTFVLRDYANVATGAVRAHQMYTLSVTGGTVTLEWGPRYPTPTAGFSPTKPDFPVGTYWDDLTGVTLRTCRFYK